jgi:hypothetical protein
MPEDIGKFRLFGFATGSYFCTCKVCKKEFMGDKRAIQCLSCAIVHAEQIQSIINGSAALVLKWTNSAQSSSNNDAERNIYYQCAEDLHRLNNLCRKAENG